MSPQKIVIIGAGIGGLTCGALLAKQGLDVTVMEAQTYPGGSASTFYHKGYRFDSGATVAGGFHEMGPHAVVGEKLGITWPIKKHDPAWVVHLPDHRLLLDQNFSGILNAFPHSAQFWEEQATIAETAWKLARQQLAWPPGNMRDLVSLAQVAAKNPISVVRLLPHTFSTVYQWMARKGVWADKTFRRFIDASLLISAQNTGQHVNAAYGATALHLPRQGVYHVVGGMGAIAHTLVNKLEDFGGSIFYRHRVKQIVTQNGSVKGVIVGRNRTDLEDTFVDADIVLANMTPWALAHALGKNAPSRLEQEILTRKSTQGAFVLHLGMESALLPKDIESHHQIVRSIDGPLGDGETVFVSISPSWDHTRAPQGFRAVTISTHTDVQHWWDLLNMSEGQYQEQKAHYAEKMIDTVSEAIPGFKRAIAFSMAGTPVTYETYTLRYRGMVGGFPQTTLLDARGPQTWIRNLWLVGDSIFPGQSTAGVTLGAMRVTNSVLASVV